MPVIGQPAPGDGNILRCARPACRLMGLPDHPQAFGFCKQGMFLAAIAHRPRSFVSSGERSFGFGRRHAPLLFGYLDMSRYFNKATQRSRGRRPDVSSPFAMMPRQRCHGCSAGQDLNQAPG